MSVILTPCLAAALLAISTLSARAQDRKDGPPCSDKTSTMEISECVMEDAKVWDKRLNTAYQALLPFVDPEQREPLRKAQRLWIQYRDANCAFYAAHEGTISRILVADCMWTMTRDRTLELESDAKP